MMDQAEDLKSPLAKHAREVIQSLVRARKNLRLYPSNNPIYQKIVSETHNKFNEFFNYSEELSLRFSRNEISVSDEPIYQSDSKDENLALFFFRDGLRELRFQAGIDAEELEVFLRIISYDFDREDVEDDIVTLLWEKDFKFIKYVVDESVLSEDESYQEKAEAQAKEGANTEDNLKQAYDEVINSEEKHEFAVIPVTDSDLKALVKEIERDTEDKTVKLINIIFDALSQAETRQECEDYAAILNNSIDYCMRNRDLQRVVHIINRTKQYHDASGKPEVKKSLHAVFTHIGSAEMIREFGGLLDGVSGFDDEAFTQYIGLLGPAAVGPFMELLSDMKTGAGKKRVVNALTIIGKYNLDALARGLNDPRLNIVRSVIFVFRTIGDKKAAHYLVGLAMHEDISVRKDVIITLGDLADESILPTLNGFLEDTESQVRTSAARAMGKIGSPLARDFILGKIMSKSTLQAEFQELKVYFEVIAKWPEPHVIETLIEIVNKKHFFNRKSYDMLKAGAVYCLGLIGSKDTLEELSKISESSNKTLGDYAKAALKRIENG